MTTINPALKTVSEKNAATLDLAYGTSKLKLLNEQRTESVFSLSATASNMLRCINGEEIYDCEIGISESKDAFVISIYLLEFNGEFNGYEATKLRMVDSLLSLTADAINKVEAENKNNDVLVKADYIQSISAFIHKEAEKLSANMTIMCDSYTIARLESMLPDSCFKQNLTISYFDRFLAVTDALGADYWAGVSDSIIDSSLYNADSTLRRVAEELGLYEVNYDSSGRQIGFGKLAESQKANA